MATRTSFDFFVGSKQRLLNYKRARLTQFKAAPLKNGSSGGSILKEVNPDEVTKSSMWSV